MGQGRGQQKVNKGQVSRPKAEKPPKFKAFKLPRSGWWALRVWRGFWRERGMEKGFQNQNKIPKSAATVLGADGGWVVAVATRQGGGGA